MDDYDIEEAMGGSPEYNPFSCNLEIAFCIDRVVQLYKSAKYLLLAKQYPILLLKLVISAYKSLALSVSSLSYLTFAGNIAK